MNEVMQPLDWGIVLVTIAFLCGVILFCNHFVKNSADFLAAGRCAKRYMLCISAGIANFAVVNSVGSFQQLYQAGLSANWWGFVTTPLMMAMALVGWVTYRFRETRCFTTNQFFEVRYSKRFRVATGIIAWLSGIVNYGIFPAVSVRFFMFFCRLPDHCRFLGVNWDVYGVLLTIAIGLGTCFAMFGGQVGIIVTDFLQGVFCNVAFLVFIFFIFNLGKWDVFGGMISWDQIGNALLMAEPGQSQVNAYDCSEIPDFNIWYFLIGIFAMVATWGTWQGSAGYSAAAKNPHENKMAGILGNWRSMAQNLMLTLFPLVVIAIMRLPEFSNLAEAITTRLAAVADPQLRSQGLVPTALSQIMPTGLLGLFVAVMFMAMLSTDDTYLHSWGILFVQDVIMPFRKKPFTTRQHLRFMRLSILFVAVFAWCFSFFFRQTDYVLMFFAITGAIVAGFGPAVIGGLYWKRGGTWAAWCSFVYGAVVATGGIVLQQVWAFSDGSGLARFLADHFHWQWVLNSMARFPLNGQWIAFIGTAGCVLLYIGVSLFEHYVLKRPDFNLDKMLHRNEYDTNQEHLEQSKVSTLAQRLGITKEFSRMDKLIYYASIVWSLIWFAVFIWFTIQYFCFGHVGVDGKWISGVPDRMWLAMWKTQIYSMLVLGIVVTVWFLLGGLKDGHALFVSLRTMHRDDSDDGTVVDGRNAGEKEG